MSTKTYLDTNFFDRFRDWSEQDKVLVQQAFRNRRYSLYISGELFIEMAAVLRTLYSDRLLERTRFLADIIGSARILKYGGTLVKEELNNKGFVEPFLSSGKAETLKKFIVSMSNGLTPAHIPQLLEDIKKRKQEDQVCFSSVKGCFRLKAEERFRIISSKEHDFNETCVWVEKMIREDDPKTLSDYRGTVSGSRYSYTNAMVRSLAAMTHINAIENRGVKPSDGFDVQHLVYLVGMDLLISADVKMKRACELVFMSKLRVLTPVEFLKELKGTQQRDPLVLRQAQDERK